MKIKLSDHFTYSRLIRYSLPSIVMMIFTSIYTVVDGLFVSNIAGANALSSINIVMPLISIIGAFGFMLGTGGGAVVAMSLGQGKKQRANEYFSMIIVAITLIGIVLSALGIIFLEPICRMLGASDILMPYCISYARILLFGIVAFMLQTTFQTFFVVAERPHLGLWLTIASGITNMVLDYLFIAVLRLGISGAAIATVIGYVVGGIIPLVYFILPNKSLLRIVRPHFYPRVLLNSCFNGSSEMMTNISMSIVTLLYNLQMMRMLGEDGVAAISVIMYINFVFVAIFIGYSMGTAPIVGYDYGAGNHLEMKNLKRKSFVIIGVSSLIMTITAVCAANFLASMFVGESDTLKNMTSRGLIINSASYIICGFNIYGSSFFTALCNGKISALISFLRSLLLQVIMIIVLPIFLNVDGIWLAVPVAELLTLVVTIICFVTQKKRYDY